MQRFEFDDGRNERIEPTEARQVVERWMAHQHDPSQDWPSVQDLAEALRTTPDQVRQMLAQVRSTPSATLVAARRPLLSAKVWHLGLGIVIGSVVLSAVFSTLFGGVHRGATVITSGGYGPPGVIAVAPVDAYPTGTPAPSEAPRADPGSAATARTR